MAFYQRLKDLKEDADLTQAEVSEIIEVSANHYGKYERGETDIPFSKAIKLVYLPRFLLKNSVGLIIKIEQE